MVLLLYLPPPRSLLLLLLLFSVLFSPINIYTSHKTRRRNIFRERRTHSTTSKENTENYEYFCFGFSILIQLHGQVLYHVCDNDCNFIVIGRFRWSSVASERRRVRGLFFVRPVQEKFRTAHKKHTPKSKTNHIRSRYLTRSKKISPWRPKPRPSRNVR